VRSVFLKDHRRSSFCLQFVSKMSEEGDVLELNEEGEFVVPLTTKAIPLETSQLVSRGHQICKI